MQVNPSRRDGPILLQWYLHWNCFLKWIFYFSFKEMIAWKPVHFLSWLALERAGKIVGVLPYKDLRFVLEGMWHIPVKARKSAEIAMHPIRLILVLFPPSLTVNAFHNCLSSIRLSHPQSKVTWNKIHMLTFREETKEERAKAENRTWPHHPWGYVIWLKTPRGEVLIKVRWRRWQHLIAYLREGRKWQKPVPCEEDWPVPQTSWS